MELFAGDGGSRQRHRKAVAASRSKRGTSRRSSVRSKWWTRPTRLVRTRSSALATVHQREATGLTKLRILRHYSPNVRGDGGLVSTAADYAAFVQLFLNEGRWHGQQLLKPETVRMMTTNQIGTVVVETMPAAMPRRSAPFPFGAGKDKFGFGFQITMTEGRPPTSGALEATPGRGSTTRISGSIQGTESAS